MKRHRNIIFFTLIATIVVLLFLCINNKSMFVSTPNSPLHTNMTQTFDNHSINNTSVLSGVSHFAAGVSSHLIPYLDTKAERMAGVLSTYNDVPIEFYGRVQDQFGKPVAGAVVNFGVRVYNATEETVKRGQVTTDENGLFTINGYRGESLGLGVTKPGYTFVSVNGSTIYSKLWPDDQRSHPDQNNPTLVKMWKHQGAEHLISFNFQTYIPVDGTPTAFDIQAGRQVKSGGDIVISIRSSSVPKVHDEYNWLADITMASGGLIRAKGVSLQQMFQAPDSGYDTKVYYSFEKETPSWTPRFSEDFYFKSRGGSQFGKIWLEIDSDVVKNGSALVDLKGFLNPAGSRNLEIDPAMVTSAHP